MEESLSAEMRFCQSSKGGMKYELVLPVDSLKSKKPAFTAPRGKTTSLVDIQRRQDQAELRRLRYRITRIPSQHLNHVEEVRERRSRSIDDFRRTVKKESDQRIKKSEMNRGDHIKSLQMKSMLIDHLRPHTAPVHKELSYEAKCLEEHLNVQSKLLEELKIQTNDLIQAVRNMTLKKDA